MEQLSEMSASTLCMASASAKLATQKLWALIVEDEILVATYLADMLAEHGFHIAIATTVEKAMELINERNSFAIAFIDLNLTDQPGIELIADLQMICPTLPIVMATAYGAMAKQDMDNNARQIPILDKPYEKQALAQVLLRLGFYLPS